MNPIPLKREMKSTVNALAWHAVKGHVLSKHFVLSEEAINCIESIYANAYKLREIVDNLTTLEFKHASTEEVHSGNTSGDVT